MVEFLTMQQMVQCISIQIHYFYYKHFQKMHLLYQHILYTANYLNGMNGETKNIYIIFSSYICVAVRWLKLK